MNMAFMSLNQIDVSYDKKKQILKGLNLNVEKGFRNFCDIVSMFSYTI